MQFVLRALASAIVKGDAFASALTVMLALALSGCALNADKEPPLTLTEAAKNYLATICPVNQTWGKVDVAVDALQIEQDRGETGNAKAVYEAIAEVESATRNAAEKLSSLQWPESAQTDIDKIVESLEEDAEHAKDVRNIPVEKLAEYNWPGAKKSQELAAQARQSLNVTQSCSEFLDAQESASKPSKDAE